MREKFKNAARALMLLSLVGLLDGCSLLNPPPAFDCQTRHCASVVFEVGDPSLKISYIRAQTVDPAAGRFTEIDHSPLVINELYDFTFLPTVESIIARGFDQGGRQIALGEGALYDGAGHPKDHVQIILQPQAQ